MTPRTIDPRKASSPEPACKRVTAPYQSKSPSARPPSATRPMASGPHALTVSFTVENHGRRSSNVAWADIGGPWCSRRTGAAPERDQADGKRPARADGLVYGREPRASLVERCLG